MNFETSFAIFFYFIYYSLPRIASSVLLNCYQWGSCLPCEIPIKFFEILCCSQNCWPSSNLCPPFWTTAVPHNVSAQYLTPHLPARASSLWTTHSPNWRSMWRAWYSLPTITSKLVGQHFYFQNKNTLLYKQLLYKELFSIGTYFLL